MCKMKCAALIITKDPPQTGTILLSAGSRHGSEFSPGGLIKMNKQLKERLKRWAVGAAAAVGLSALLLSDYPVGCRRPDEVHFTSMGYYVTAKEDGDCVRYTAKPAPDSDDFTEYCPKYPDYMLSDMLINSIDGFLDKPPSYAERKQRLVEEEKSFPEGVYKPVAVGMLSIQIDDYEPFGTLETNIAKGRGDYIQAVAVTCDAEDYSHVCLDGERHTNLRIRLRTAVIRGMDEKNVQISVPLLFNEENTVREYVKVFPSDSTGYYGQKHYAELLTHWDAAYKEWKQDYRRITRQIATRGYAW